MTGGSGAVSGGINGHRRSDEPGHGAAGCSNPRSAMIRARRLWDGLSDTVTDNVDVLVVDGRIAVVGRSLPVPAGLDVVDLGDRTLCPGFIDCHVHVATNAAGLGDVYRSTAVRKALDALSALRTLLSNGFTTVRDLGAFDSAFITVDLRNAIEDGLIVGPRMIVAPHILGPSGGHGDMRGLLAPGVAPLDPAVADGCDAAITAVRNEIACGADWIKLSGSGGFSTPSDGPDHVSYTQAELDSIVRAAADLDVPVTLHAFNDEALLRAAHAGARSVEHASLAGEQTLAALGRAQIVVTPTQFSILRQAKAAVDHDDAFWAGRPLHKRRKYERFASRLLDSASVLATSPVTIAFGTDAGMIDYQDGPREFATLVSNGVENVRALRAATSVAAELLRRPDLGRIAEGCTADLIAMPGDPLTDVRATEQVDFVMKEGLAYRLPQLP